jgi:hypothetical protein
MRAAVLATLLAMTAVPAHAASLGFSDVAHIYCDAVISGRMEPVLDLLTDGLHRLVDRNGQVPILWQGKPEPAETCFPVGNSGTRDRPETIVSFGYTTGGKRGFAQTIVMVFVGGNLRIDDVQFEDGTTLRERLRVRA